MIYKAKYALELSFDDYPLTKTPWSLNQMYVRKHSICSTNLVRKNPLVLTKKN